MIFDVSGTVTDCDAMIVGWVGVGASAGVMDPEIVILDVSGIVTDSPVVITG
jgi:hypothetical protein